MVARKLFIANWKLNHSRASATNFFRDVFLQIEFCPNLEIAVAPTAPMLELVSRLISEKPMALAAQNVFYENIGAYTGEWSAMQLAELNVRYCIVGHSERRDLFFETDEVVAKKARACVDASVIPVVCVGETAKERANGDTIAVITRQVSSVLDMMTDHAPWVIAYEPKWAIGSGKTPSGLEIEEVHALLRTFLKKQGRLGLANEARILYGGSVTSDNIGEIARNVNVDGVLVGGASLQASSFLSMVEKLRLAE